MQKRDPKPQIDRLEEIVIQVRTGEIKLPKFQRSFVWKENDILKLFDSIYNGYPIGSLLLWYSSQKLKSEREILGVEINTKQAIAYPTNYLLDGQQRLTSLCGALYWDGMDETSKWNIGFNLETETFHQMKSAPKGVYFPLNKLMETSQFLQQCNEYSELKTSKELVKKAESLLRAVKDYKLAVVIIGDMTVEEVAPIFERINSTGRKLTIVDLMMAATWSNDFDLNAEIISIQDLCSEHGYSEIPSKIILRCFSTTADLGINKDDIQKLRKIEGSSLKEISNKVKVSIIRSINFYIDYIGAYDFSYIPYALQFNYVVEFFNLNSNPSGSQLNELASWVWFTNATRYFGTSNSGQNKKDLDNIRKYAVGDTEYLYERGSIDISRLLFDNFNLRNATSTSFALFLGTSLPDKAADGRLLDGGYKYVKNSKFYASAVPKNIVWSKLNISMVIHTFAQEKHVELTDRDLSGLFVDDESKAFLHKGNYEGFIRKRSDYIKDFIAMKTGCTVSFSLPPQVVNENFNDFKYLSEDEDFDSDF
jgi:hypothetical protein